MEQRLALLPRLLTAGVLLLIAAAIAALVFWPQLTGGVGPGSSLLQNNLFWLILAVVPAVIGLYYGITASGDGLLGKVAHVEGTGQQRTTVSYSNTSTGASTSRRRSRRATYTYYYEIGERRFKVRCGAHAGSSRACPTGPITRPSAAPL